MFEPTKVCPSCQGEFRMHVERCPDCETTLVLQEMSFGERPVPRGYALGPDEIPDGEMLTPLGISGEPHEVREVSVLLSQEEIRHWLIPRGEKEVHAAYQKPQDYIDMYVLTGNLDRASAVVRRNLWGDSSEGRDLEEVLGDTSVCPACSTPLPTAAVSECPECGLVLGE